MEFNEKLNVIIVISNPYNYKRRYVLANECIKRLLNTNDIELYIVEMVYQNQEYMITNPDNKNHLQLKTKYPFWHKENMINLGVNKLLPNNWKNFAYIDLEVEFIDYNWGLNTLRQLENVDFLQLYSKCHEIDIYDNIINTNTSFLYNYLNNKDILNKSTNYGFAMNRKTYENINGLYDKGINGNSEIFFYSILNKDKFETELISDFFKVNIIDYQNQIKNNNEIKVGYLSTIIKYNLGNKSNSKDRNETNKILKEYNFNPSEFLTYENDILVPTRNFPFDLYKDLNEYFKNINEDEYLDEINNIKRANKNYDNKLNVIIVISNPSASIEKYQLANDFINRMEQENDVIFYIIEFCSKDQEFVLTKNNNDRHLQLRDDVEYNKEKLINIGVKNLLPTNWKSFAWIDFEIEFLNSNWEKQTLELLKTNDIIQLYSECLLLDENKKIKTIYTSFGKDYSYENKYNPNREGSNYTNWNMDFGWAINKKTWNKINGLYDKSIEGIKITLLSMINEISNFDSDAIEYKNDILNNDFKIGYLPIQIKHFKTLNTYDKNITLNDMILNNKIKNDKLNVIMVISNPNESIQKYILAKEFIERFENNHDIILYIVEICYDQQHFIITNSDNNNHLQLRAEIPIWHKENMTNLCVDNLLPKDWKYFAYIDFNIEFIDKNWAIETLKLLNSNYDAVQLFSECINTDKSKNNSFAASLDKTEKNNIVYGYAWAYTRETFENLDGLYDKCLIGNNDEIIALSMTNKIDELIKNNNFNKEMINEINTYQEFVQKNKYNIGYLKSNIKCHLQEIPISNDIISKHNYDPLRHISYTINGILVPTNDCPPELLFDLYNQMKHNNNNNDDMIIDNLISDKIENKLNVIMVISNPCNFKRRYQLASEFVTRMENNNDVNLYIVEMCYENQKFMVTKPNNKNHLQLRTKYPLWHKENMINLGVRQLLPKNWKSFAWIDADIEFLDEDWANKTLKLLTKYDVLQLYSDCLFLDVNSDIAFVNISFAKDYSYENKYKPNRNAVKFTNWNTGFCWAMTRNVWNSINGIYDKSIIGNGDSLFILSLIKESRYFLNKRKFNKEFKNSFLYYENKINLDDIKIGYLSTQIIHHFHGQLKNRNYINRCKLLIDYKFDPSIYLTYKNNILIPSNKFPIGLIDDIKNYFKERNEDECINILNNNISNHNIKILNIKNRYKLNNDIINSSEKIEEKLNVIMVISNACLYIRRYQLAYEFIERVKNNKDINLYIVEMCYKDQEFFITSKNNTNHLQLRTDVPLWHKENMINLGVKHLLPNDWKAFAWVDADIEFLDNDWANKTLKLLNNYDIVQLYSECLFLDEKNEISFINTSFGKDYSFENKYNLERNGTNFTNWNPGFCWAITRKLWEDVNGLYDKNVICSGDNLFILSLIGGIEEYLFTRTQNKDFIVDIINYKNNIKNKDVKLGYLDVQIKHYFHGQIKNRKYMEGYDIINNNNYNPEKHLTYDNDGIVTPLLECPYKLLDDIMIYFQERNEDECYY